MIDDSGEPPTARLRRRRRILLVASACFAVVAGFTLGAAIALLTFEVIETDRALLLTALAVGCFATATFFAVSLHLTDGQLLSLGDDTFRFTETEQERLDRAKSAKVQMAVAPIMPILIAVLYAVEPEIVPRALVWVFCGLSIWIIIFSYLRLRMAQPRSPAS